MHVHVWGGCGRRVGRNPPSVLGDIHLIGIPAPRTELTGVYYPFHGMGRSFHPHCQPPQRMRILVLGLGWVRFCNVARPLGQRLAAPCLRRVGGVSSDHHGSGPESPANSPTSRFMVQQINKVYRTGVPCTFRRCLSCFRCRL